MSYTVVPSAVTGQIYTASHYNTQVRANLAAVWMYSAAGDMAYASAPDTLQRLPLGVGGVMIGSSNSVFWQVPSSNGRTLCYMGPISGVVWYDGVPGIFQNAGDMVYGNNSNSAARLAKASSGSVLQETAAGVPSWRPVNQTVIVNVVGVSDDVTLTSGVAWIRIPGAANGMNLLRANARVYNPGTTNAMNIQVRNETKYPINDSLSVAISIASGATVGTAGTIDTARNDVSTDDLIKIYVTAAHVIKAIGLWVELEFQLP